MNDWAKYAGMTVNERLYVAGLSEEYTYAVRDRNVEKIVAILKKVDLTMDSIVPILKSEGLL